MLETLIPSEEMGRQLMRLRYDLLQNVLRGMEQEAYRQARADQARKRFLLADALAQLGWQLSDLTKCMEKVLRICRPYIDRERNQS